MRVGVVAGLCVLVAVWKNDVVFTRRFGIVVIHPTCFVWPCKMFSEIMNELVPFSVLDGGAFRGQRCFGVNASSLLLAFRLCIVAVAESFYVRFCV